MTGCTKMQSDLRDENFINSGVTEDMAEVNSVVYNDIIQSPGDKRQYRGLLLKNNMKVLLISDPTTEKAAAAMDVHIGSISDPPELSGLAHFCEHMLFMGTEKYPSENGFQMYITENGGSSNAFTTAEDTNFYFDIKHDCLHTALDRFAQFFISPLFNAESKDKEVNAVDSEHNKNINNDHWRLDQLEKHTGNPDHPYCHFGTGNRVTLDTKPKELGIDVREELLKFHDRYYSANLMSLCVLGRESVDELSKMVEDLFSSVEDQSVTAPEFPLHPYGEEQCKLEIKVVPVKERRDIKLTFPIPDLTEYYESKPAEYVAHLIGHEGKGSLLSELKAKGWANCLVAGPKSGAKGFMFFICSMDITNDGLNHINEIVHCFFQYIEMLKQQEPPKWVFDECKALANMHFRFKDKEAPTSYVSSTSMLLHLYPIPVVLQSPYLLNSFRPDLIKSLISHLTPDKVRILLSSKTFEGTTDQVESWYGTQYSVRKIDEEMIQKWKNVELSESLHLPEVNDFIPDDFEIRDLSCEQQIPILIKDTPLSNVWFKQDDKFHLPKAYLYFEISSPLMHLDPSYYNMAYLFVELLKDSLNEYSYAASVAGIDFKLDINMYALVLSVKGYNDKQKVLLKKFLERATSFVVDTKRFPFIKEAMERALKSRKAEQPYQHAVYYTSFLLAELAWSIEELIAALEDITAEKLQAFIPQLLSRIHLDSLVYGNLTKQEVLEVVEIVETTLTDNSSSKALLPSQLVRKRGVQLADGCSYLYKTTNEVHSTSGVEIYYQCGLENTRSNVELELFCQIIKEPCFNTLRTQQQLGYIVFSGVRRNNGSQGLRFIIQSDKKPASLDSNIEEFLKSTEDIVKNMSEEDFKNNIESLAVKKLEKPKKMSREASKFWGEIMIRQFNFERDNIEVEMLRTITKEDILNFYQTLLSSSSPKRSKMAVYVSPTKEEETSEEKDTGDDEELPSKYEVIEDVVKFKSSLPLFPLVMPYNSSSPSAKSKL